MTLIRYIPLVALLTLLDLPTARAQTFTLQPGTKDAEESPEEALKRYRALHARNPRRVDILYRLSGLLSTSGHHDEAIALLKKHLQRLPGDIGGCLRLGDALFARGDLEAAFSEWDRVAKDATSPGPYRLSADRYRRHSLYAHAETIYRKGRKALSEPLLFARELAEVAERQANYIEAVREYLLFLEAQPQYRATVEARLKEIARAGGPAEIFDFLANQVREHPDDQNRIHLLVEYALPSDRADQLLRILMQTPELSWTHLFRIATYTLANRAYATSVTAHRALLERNKRTDIQSRGHLGLARAYEGIDLPDSARTYYRALIERFPKRSDEARFRLGLLLHDQNPEAALQTFHNLINTNRRTLWRYKALFEIAEGHLQADRLDLSGAALQRIIREKRNSDEGDDATFRLAELRFLSGLPDSARHLLDRLLTGKNTRYALNDALALSVLIQDETEPLLKTVGQAQKLRRQGRLERALTLYDTLLQHHSDLTDRILDARADILDALGRYSEAIQACRELITTTSWSPFCPGAQMRLALIYENRLGQYHDARKAYQAVLVNYPLSLEADSARERLRGLQKKIQDLNDKKAG